MHPSLANIRGLAHAINYVAAVRGAERFVFSAAPTSAEIYDATRRVNTPANDTFPPRHVRQRVLDALAHVPIKWRDVLVVVEHDLLATLPRSVFTRARGTDVYGRRLQLAFVAELCRDRTC